MKDTLVNLEKKYPGVKINYDRNSGKVVGAVVFVPNIYQTNLGFVCITVDTDDEAAESAVTSFINEMVKKYWIEDVSRWNVDELINDHLDRIARCAQRLKIDNCDELFSEVEPITRVELSNFESSVKAIEQLVKYRQDTKKLRREKI